MQLRYPDLCMFYSTALSSPNLNFSICNLARLLGDKEGMIAVLCRLPHVSESMGRVVTLAFLLDGAPPELLLATLVRQCSTTALHPGHDLNPSVYECVLYSRQHPKSTSQSLSRFMCHKNSKRQIP